MFTHSYSRLRSICTTAANSKQINSIPQSTCAALCKAPRFIFFSGFRPILRFSKTGLSFLKTEQYISPHLTSNPRVKSLP